MADIQSGFAEIHVVTNVTGWSTGRLNQLMAAINSVEAGLGTAPEKVESSGWTNDLVERALDLLAGSRATLQIEVVRRAIERGGSISREEVYDLGQDRSLKGFTRPTNLATQALRDSGTLPEDAEELLEPIYDVNAREHPQAKGFRVPPEIVHLYAE